MNFDLPEETQELVAELSRWAAGRPVFEVDEASDREGWKQLAEFGLFSIESDGGTPLDTACGVMAAARAPLPGPLVEGLVAAHVSDRARELLNSGGVATSAAHGPAGRQAVGWGTRADLVVDESTGHPLSEHPLPALHNAYELPLGWLEHGEHRDAVPAVVARRWLLAAAASTGLGEGAFSMTLRHTRDREVFGSPLATRQAVQMRLAESRMLLHGCELAVHDAAWRAGSAPHRAIESAALAWLYVSRSVATVMEHAHQLHGALGFCTETGLYRFSSAARWLALSSPRREANELIAARRMIQNGTPVSLVLDGFAS
jgi:hypothetical protein